MQGRHTTYFEGISTPPENSRYTADELDELAEKYNNAQSKTTLRTKLREWGVFQTPPQKKKKKTPGEGGREGEKEEEKEKKKKIKKKREKKKNEDIQNPNLGKKFSDIIEISAKNEKVLDDIHSSLNDFVRKNKKKKQLFLD